MVYCGRRGIIILIEQFPMTTCRDINATGDTTLWLRDEATGLINFRMRWYDAETGRWLSKDPIGLSGGLNLFCYSHNNPIVFGDKFGNIPVEIVKVVIVTAAIGYIVYKVYDYVKRTKNRMEEAGCDDIRRTVEGGVDCIGYLFEWFGPHGVVPDKTSILTDPIDDLIMAPVRESVINRMRPRGGGRD